MKMSVRVKSSDRLRQIIRDFDRLTRDEVLVGIPLSASLRESGQANNAEIGYTHEYGDPAARIPRRAFLEPGVRNAEPLIVKALGNGLKGILQGRPGAGEVALEIAGQVARDAVKQKITNGPFVQLSQRTLDDRKARGVKRTNPLIDTQQLRRSITYVIRRRTAR